MFVIEVLYANWEPLRLYSGVAPIGLRGHEEQLGNAAGSDNPAQPARRCEESVLISRARACLRTGDHDGIREVSSDDDRFTLGDEGAFFGHQPKD
jgi:hypothetical protein